MDEYDKISKNLHDCDKELLKKLWVQYTTGYDFGVSEARELRNNFLKKPDNLKHFKKVQGSNPRLRKTEILNREFSKFHSSPEVTKLQKEIDDLSNSLQNKINLYRPSLNEQEVNALKVSKILQDSPVEEERQKAFLSSVPLNKIVVEGGFLKLIKLRNKLAKLLGYKNFIDYSFAQSDLSSTFICVDHFKESFDFDSVKSHLNKLSTEAISDDSFKPWNTSYMKSKILSLNNIKFPPLKSTDYLEYAFNEMGFKIDMSKVTLDIFNRRNKSEWGYSFPIEIGVENRILANTSDKYMDLWVLLHELGHAFHFLSLDKNDYTHNWGVSLLIAEGFANYCGEFINREESFKFFDKELSNKEKKELLKYKKHKKYLSVASSCSMIFDMELYTKEPETLQEINQMAIDAQSLIYPKSTLGKDFPWAKTIHHTSSPVYLHNYIAGDLFFNDLTDSIPENNGANWILENILLNSGKYKFEDLYKKLLNQDFCFTTSMNKFFDKKEV